MIRGELLERSARQRYERDLWFEDRIASGHHPISALVISRYPSAATSRFCSSASPLGIGLLRLPRGELARSLVENCSTIEEQDPTPPGSKGPPEALGLVVVWCSDAPWRAGEIALLPRGTPGEPRLVGRGGPLPGDAHPRLAFARMRPDAREAAEPLASPKISRVQLIASSAGLGHITVRNVGRCPILVGGKTVDDATVGPGRTVQLGQQLLLLCVRRSVILQPAPAAYPLAAFGEPDGLGIVGESQAIWALRQDLGAIGPLPGHVLLLGPSGSGKELCARGLHDLSDRRARPLVARNAATIPESLFDAELFGNARNYPNTGMPERPGLVGEANDSTLFLDEIAELSAPMQSHLLRLLDGGEYHRLGEAVARRSHVRVVAATNRPAEQLKADLLARFPYRIALPDLNARREDIPLLAEHILQRRAGAQPGYPTAQGKPGALAPRPRLSVGFARQLVEHPFSTHVRELERLLLQAAIRADAELDGAPEVVAASAESVEAHGPGDGEPIGEAPLTAERIQAVLDEHNGRIEAASKTLGLTNRFALARLIAKHGLVVRRRPAKRGPRSR
jgi:two-component system nitrogen regulation response regulator GlnG/two-component system response regulator HydG